MVVINVRLLTTIFMLVTKRDKTQEPFDAEKIKKVINWACAGLDADPLILESNVTTNFYDGITTNEIQKQVINTAVKLCTVHKPDWRYVAGRLLIFNIWKEVAVSRELINPTYPEVVEYQVNKGRYDSTIYEYYSNEELITAGSWLKPERDLDYDYAGASLLERRYLCDDELPQEAFLTVSLFLATVEHPARRLDYAKKFYDAISQRKISLATPLLMNLRRPGTNTSSCFINCFDDSIESIFATITDIARISKNGGGVGTNVSRIRAKGSPVNGRPNSSNGVIPWIKIINDTVVAVDQGGRRAGSATVALDVWHLDIEDFLELQTEQGDPRKKAFDIFPQVVVTDEFMHRVEYDLDWTLVDPYEIRTKLNIEIAELWGEEFNKAYSIIEENVNNGVIKLFKVIKAKTLVKKILQTQLETGMPYVAFKDTINKANPNKHEGVIPSVNLCVAPETRIFTDKGYYPIADLEGEQVNTWNGYEWSEVTVKKTGTDQKLLKVHLSNGEELECTYYHHFYVQNSYKGKPLKVEAQELRPGDKLIKYSLPVVSNEDDIEFPYAYTHGAFCGDGSVSRNGHPEIDLYGDKKELLTHIKVRNKLHGSQYRTIELDEIAVYDDVNQDRLVCRLPLDLLPKFTVPLNGYTVQSRLDWFAGLLDTDGTVATNGDNQSFQINSIHKSFLLDVRLMLQTLGVDSKVVDGSEEGYREMPDGKGGKKDYFCQRSYRLLITSNGVYQLGLLGLKTNRLLWTHRQPQREASHFIKVKSVEITNRISDTFCFTEPKRHLGMFNGILTGQCVESYSVVVPHKYVHCCNLISLNQANIEDHELGDIVRLSVRALDNAIDLTTAPIEEAKAHNKRYRTIGIGQMGLADWLAKRDLSYTKAQAEVNKLSEDIAYHAFYENTVLAEERGTFEAYPGSELSQGRLLCHNKEWFINNSYDPERWLDLIDRGLITGHRCSQLLAIAPNTSTSLLQGCSASVLPVYNKFFYDKAGGGAVPVAPPFIKDKFWYYPEFRHLDTQKVIDIIATIQKWTDTGISMELVFDLNKPHINAKYLYETLLHAWKKDIKAIYYIRTIKKDLTEVDSKDYCVSCAN